MWEVNVTKWTSQFSWKDARGWATDFSYRFAITKSVYRKLSVIQPLLRSISAKRSTKLAKQSSMGEVDPRVIETNRSSRAWNVARTIGEKNRWSLGWKSNTIERKERYCENLLDEDRSSTLRIYPVIEIGTLDVSIILSTEWFYSFTLSIHS